MKTTKVKAWRIEQAVWGADRTSILYFHTKEARDEYYDTHDYCDKLRPVMVEEFDEYGHPNYYFND